MNFANNPVNLAGKPNGF